MRAVLAGLLLTGLISTPSGRRAPGAFTLTTVDGRTFSASELSIGPDGKISIPATTETTPARLEDLVQILPPGAAASSPARESEGSVTIVLADGGELRGKLLPGGAGPGILADVGLPRPVSFPLSSLAAIRISNARNEAAERELDARLSHRDATRDFLIALGAEGATAVPGALEGLTPDEWTFKLGGQLRRGSLARTYAIVFAAGSPGAPGRGDGSARVVLRSGARFAATLLSADEGGLRLRTSFDADVSLPWSEIERVDLQSARVEFVSNLKPTEVVSRGYFGDAWPWSADRGLQGGPLKIGGLTFAKGLAVHSQSRLSYELSEPFGQFQATIGVDDPARQGNVVFRVLGDGRALFESGAVKAGEAPREISVELKGARRLVLEVDFGEGLDVGDRAVWGNARLIR